MKAGRAAPAPDPMYASLRNTAEFDHVLRSGARYRRGGITLVAVRRVEAGSRVGLVASRRIGTAVVRNRAKRRLRAAIREVGLPGRLDCVFIASKAVAVTPFDTLCRWVRQATEDVSTGRRRR